MNCKNGNLHRVIATKPAGENGKTLDTPSWLISDRMRAVLRMS